MTTRAHIRLTGATPLLMHADNIEWADAMEAWKANPENKAKSKAGDDRTPPFRWIGCLNFDDAKSGVVTIPSEYIMRSIMAGAAEVSTGKGKKTFKSQSQSGLLCDAFHLPLLVNGRTVPMSKVQELREVKTFAEHMSGARDLGFELFVRRARVGMMKHIRVRPRFDNWSAEGEITIVDDDISLKVLQQILDISGRFKGLGDWRPGCLTPGAFGMFKAEVS